MEEKAFETIEEVVSNGTEVMEAAADTKLHWGYLVAVPIYWAVCYVQGEMFGNWIGDKITGKR